jgi:protein involved in polysaccharide export with SLBB domain
LPVLSARAQEFPTRSRAAQYYLGTEDELLIPINIWGFVEKPGQYMVPNNTDLISLMSFAGGPTDGANTSSIQIVRSDPRYGNRVWKVNVKKYLKTADDKLVPLLKPGDTVLVKGTAFNKVKSFFSFLTSFAIFAQMLYWIVIVQDRID